MKYFFLFILLLINLNASYVDKYNIIDTFQVSKDGKDYKSITYKEYKTNKVKILVLRWNLIRQI